ncbi:somatostatin receptor type 5-like [Pleurodeles waltl]|uniref:somatostatin receptor type 5-like n=1 Tax=Pleurodeles waltl TaxID=8319 RepID=UPI003709567B
MDYFSNEDLAEELSDSNDSFTLNATFTDEIDYGVNYIAIPTVYFLLSAFGLSTNTLAFYITLRYTKLSKTNNIYIFNLIIADILVMFGLVFTASQQIKLYWPFGSFLCKIVMTIDFINPLVSIFFIMVMSISHCVSVYCPKKSPVCQRLAVAKRLSALTWLIASLFVLLVIIFADVDTLTGQCTIIWPEPGSLWDTTYTLCIFAMGFCIPISVNGVTYLLLLVKAKKVASSTDPNSCQGASGSKLMLGLWIVFILCWLPLNLLSVIDVIGGLPAELVKAYDMVVILAYAKSCINPIIYKFLSDDYKQGYKTVLGC